MEERSYRNDPYYRQFLNQIRGMAEDRARKEAEATDKQNKSTEQEGVIAETRTTEDSMGQEVSLTTE